VISTVGGRVAAVHDDHVIIEVAGIGFKVFVPRSLADALGSGGGEVKLFTHMHVRENEIALYGCRDADELRLFELLLGVSGIGPKLALNVVSAMSAQDLRDAIARGDGALLTRIPGVGRKTAERVMLDLKDKLGVSLEFVCYPAMGEGDAEVIAALTSLGYSVVEAQAALRSLPRDDGMPLEDRVLGALQYLGAERLPRRAT
jgi:Holliday junction DNA helicase RuvA